MTMTASFPNAGGVGNWIYGCAVDIQLERVSRLARAIRMILVSEAMVAAAIAHYGSTTANGKKHQNAYAEGNPQPAVHCRTVGFTASVLTPRPPGCAAMSAGSFTARLP